MSQNPENPIPPDKSKKGISFLTLAGTKPIGDEAAANRFAKKIRKEAWERKK